MKRHFFQKILFIAFLGLALLSSCNPSDQTATLVVIPVTFNLPPLSSERTFTVKTTENWYMEQVGNEDWCTVYPDKGTPGETKVTLNVTALPDEKPRIAIYVIKSTSGIEKTLTVEQTNTEAGSYYINFFGNPDPMISVDPFDVEPIQRLVFTNVPEWKVTVSAGAENWLSANRKKDTLLITISDIDRPQSREGTVTALGGGSVSTTLTISQKGLHEFLAPTRNFSLPIPGVPDSELAFSDVYSRARITMLFMWASWCPDCSNFMPKVKELYTEFKGHGFKIYGAAMEMEGREQEYFDYLANNGLNDVDETTGNKLWWENRPVFNPQAQVKVNAFTRLFYGDALLTGEIKNFVPAFFFVDGAGNIKKVYADNYVLRTDAAVRSLYSNMRTFLSRQLECCGN
ncbi:MAG: thioredoxin-like domain-containing protein [Bacteroidales bacterium]|nr:thioredoxin-like domain-containing protein [Bacteroidales bacterium]